MISQDLNELADNKDQWVKIYLSELCTLLRRMELHDESFCQQIADRTKTQITVRKSMADAAKTMAEADKFDEENGWL